MVTGKIQGDPPDGLVHEAVYLTPAMSRCMDPEVHAPGGSRDSESMVVSASDEACSMRKPLTWIFREPDTKVEIAGYIATRMTRAIKTSINV